MSDPVVAIYDVVLFLVVNVLFVKCSNELTMQIKQLYVENIVVYSPTHRGER